MADPPVAPQFRISEPRTTCAVQLIVLPESPRFSTLMFCTVDVSLPCRDWNRTAVMFNPKMLPEFATNNSTGTSRELVLAVTQWIRGIHQPSARWRSPVHGRPWMRWRTFVPLAALALSHQPPETTATENPKGPPPPLLRTSRG